MPERIAAFCCGMILLLPAAFPGGFLFSLDSFISAYAEEGSPKATLEDAKEEASQEASRIDDHAKNLKQSVKKDTTAAGKTLKHGIQSGFGLLKEGIRSLGRGEGVKVEKSAREEQDPSKD